MNSSGVGILDLNSGAFTTVSGKFINSGTISADGRYVAYSIDDGPDAGFGVFKAVYLFDKVSGSTTLIERSDENIAFEIANNNPWISADGHFVAFGSHDSVVPGHSGADYDIYLDDLQGGGIRRVYSDGTNEIKNIGS